MVAYIAHLQFIEKTFPEAQRAGIDPLKVGWYRVESFHAPISFVIWGRFVVKKSLEAHYGIANNDTFEIHPNNRYTE
jgi:hypothetical protein